MFNSSSAETVNHHLAEEWASRVLLQVGALDVLGEEGTSSSDSLGLDGASSSTDQDRALGVLLEDGASVSSGQGGL